MDQNALLKLTALLGTGLATDPATRRLYGKGESYPHTLPPELVVFPHSTAEVSAIAAICSEHHIPMIPSGACTSLEGHITAPQGGVSINLAQMNRIRAVNEGDLDCVVEAGVTREQLNTHLRDRGLFFPVDPGANATLGGMASTRASGTTAIRYGTMATNVMGLTVVQPDGTIIQTGGRARKSSAGYDLTHLYVGAEGTLGIITEVRLRLYGIPETINAAICAFDDVRAAVDAVTEIVQLGIPVARIELLDEVQIKASNAYSRLSLAEKPHLFFEFHGSRHSTDEQASAAAAIAAAHGGSGFEWASTTEARNQLWKARHQALFAALALRPGADVWTSDVCVPITHLAAAISGVRADIEAQGLIAPILGHVGDGNFHVLFVLDPQAPAERAAAEAVYDRMVDSAISCGGTCTGEHGIGLMKRKKLVAEHGEAAVLTMQALKRALDPRGLMNPGKIFLSRP